MNGKENIITIDGGSCIGDFACAAVCPMGIIERGELHPAAAGDAAELCIDCGHCVAVCPTGALFHRTASPDECDPVDRGLLPSREQTVHLFRSRRSVRSFGPEPADRESIGEIISIAGYAPSGHNSRPVRWLVLREGGSAGSFAAIVIDWMRSMLAEQALVARALHMDRMVADWESGIDRVCRGAPHILVAFAQKLNPLSRDACVIALSHAEIAAHSLGLGACWAGYFQAAAAVWPPLQQALALPPGHASFGALLIGRPAVEYRRIPPRSRPEILWR